MYPSKELNLVKIQLPKTKEKVAGTPRGGSVVKEKKSV
jgi:hypothetical protein